MEISAVKSPWPRNSHQVPPHALGRPHALGHSHSSRGHHQGYGWNSEQSRRPIDITVSCPRGTRTRSSSILMPSWLLMPSRLLMPYRHKITCLPSTIATTTSTSLARKSLAARHRSPRPDLSSFLMPSWLLMPSRHRLVQQHITYLPIRQKNRDTNAINWNCSPALHRSPTQAHCTVVSAP